MGFFVYALTLTYSRGGLLGLITSVLIYLYGRFGWQDDAPRGADPAGDARDGRRATGQFLRQRRHGPAEDPALGGGPDAPEALPHLRHRLGTLSRGVRAEAHNSFVHGFVELGFAGGANVPRGLLLRPGGALRKLAPARGVEVLDPELQRLRPYLMGMIGGYAVGILTISRCYIVPTYMVLGLATAYLGLAETDQPVELGRFDKGLIRKFAVWGLIFLVVIYLYTRVAVRYG